MNLLWKKYFLNILYWLITMLFFGSILDYSYEKYPLVFCMAIIGFTISMALIMIYSDGKETTK